MPGGVSMWVYQLLIRLLLPLAAILIVFTKNKTPNFVSQRLGFGYKNIFKNQQPIWIHCASVGEVKAIEQLVQYFSKQHAILITTNTPTSKMLIDSLFNSKNIHHQYFPYDLPIFIKNFIKTHNPSTLWVIETEIWPNLFQISYKHDIRIKILNGRLSQKTLTAPNWLKKSYSKSLNLVSLVITRNQLEADNFITLGVARKNLRVIGNLKYAGLTNIQPQKSAIKRPFVLLASSHPSEELAIVNLWDNLKREELLVIVPRHPKRRDSIIEELDEYRDELAVYSLKEKIESTTAFYLMDTIGKLTPLFTDAKLVIMGGSFVKKGGHNILEPASVKSAIITGEDMSDFEDETELLKEFKGIQQVNSYEQLEQLLPTLLDNEKVLQQQGENAYQAILSQQNILNEYLEQLT